MVTIQASRFWKITLMTTMNSQSKRHVQVPKIFNFLTNCEMIYYIVVLYMCRKLNDMDFDFEHN